MKLLFSISFYTPYVSGLTLYVKRLAENLGKRHSCTVLTNRHKQNLVLEEDINGVKIERAKPLFQISKGYFSLDFVFKSFSEAKKSDVVFINLPQFEGFIPAIFGKFLGKRVISIYHCEVILPFSVFNLFVESCLLLANFISLMLSNAIITYTDDFAIHSRWLSYFGKKLLTVYPPINKPIINNRVQKVLLDKIGKNNEILIGVAARLAAEKGVEYLLEAIPLLEEKLKIQNSKFKILIAGSLDPVGEESYKAKIFKLVEKYKENIVFLGELKEEDMGSFYSLLDVLVLPSVNSTEAFGMVQVEAMMMGIPAVATDLPGVRIPIKKTGMGKIVPIRNSEKLSVAIVEILINKKKYIKDAKDVVSEFSIDKTLKFYENLIKNE